MIIELEEKFYVGEEGFYLTVATGLNMEGTVQGEVRSVLRRPGGSMVTRTIPVADILQPSAGVVLMPFGVGDLSVAGQYQAQIFLRQQGGRARPSHILSFEVEAPLVANSASLFG